MSVPKWALIRDDNNKTSSIVKTKNLPSNNPSIRIVSLSSIILPHSKVAKPLKPIIVFDCYCFIALSVSGKKSALESDENTDLSSCSSDDEDTSSDESSSEDEVLIYTYILTKSCDINFLSQVMRFSSLTKPKQQHNN